MLYRGECKTDFNFEEPVAMPEYIDDKKLLVLDLDETLIYAAEFGTGRQPEFRLEFTTASYNVFRRPHLDAFIDYCFENFKVAVWTASGEGYAKAMVSKIFGERAEKLEFVWTVAHCELEEVMPLCEEYIKKLDKLQTVGFQLDSTIIVDDTPLKIRYNEDNLVVISPFTGNTDDTELLTLRQYLDELKNHSDIRTIEKRGWQNKYRGIRVDLPPPAR